MNFEYTYEVRGYMGEHTRNESDIPRVVIIDDDPIYLRVWEKILRGISECHYCLTNDPNTLYSILKEQHVDLVISDVVMRPYNGYEIAHRIYQHHPQVQVLLTTGYDCNLQRFNLDNPNFHILYKPYQNIGDIQRFVEHLVQHEDVFEDSTEDSFSENEDFPNVTEWFL
jgi:two-component SAPR family response regulator